MRLKHILVFVVVVAAACASPRDSAIPLPSVRGWLPHSVTDAGDVAFERGLAAFRRKEWHRAIEAFREARAAGVKGFSIDHYTGRAYLELHDYQDAVAALERAAAVQPDDTATQNALWQAYRGTGQAAKALAAFKRVVRRDPRQLATLHPQEVAERRRERAIATIPTPTKEIVFPEDDEEVGAVPDVAPVPPAAPPPGHRARPRMLLSEAYDAAAPLSAPDPPPAASVPSSPAINPAASDASPPPATDAATWMARGTALARDSRYEEAIAAYREAERADPDNPEVYNNLGNAYFALFDVDKARSYYRQTLEHDPENVWGMNNMGYTYFATQEYGEAVQWFQRALSRQPDHLFARMNLGVAFHSMEAYDQAIREFRRLLEDHPDTAKAYYNLGLSYTLKADYAHAREAFETYLRLAPDAVERGYVEEILAGFGT
jgi:tetratricopeptide (TPR) repeat protein